MILEKSDNPKKNGVSLGAKLKAASEQRSTKDAQPASLPASDQHVLPCASG